MTSLTDSAQTALQLIVSLDPVFLAIVGRSLAVSACACVLACSVGLVLGAWLGVARFMGRGVLLTNQKFYPDRQAHQRRKFLVMQ